MARTTNRREFLRDLGLSAAALPFLLNLPSLGFANQQQRKQRLVVMFSPNGVIPSAFWPDEEGREVHAQGEPQAARAVQEPDADPARRLRQGPRRRRQPHARDGLPADRHRAVSRATSRAARTRPPAGRAGISIDQEIKNFLQKDPTHADPVRLARVRRDGPRPGRHLDADGLRRARTSRSRRSTIPTRCSPSSTAG